MDPLQLPEERVAEMIAGIAAYLQRERSLYLRASDSLSPTWKTTMQPYFPKALLDIVKAVTLNGARIPPPPFNQLLDSRPSLLAGEIRIPQIAR